MPGRAAVKPRGLTLLECIVGMTMASVLLAATCGVLLAGHRSALALVSSLEARQNLEVTASILRAELRAAATGELLRASDTSIVLRALRGSGHACAIDTAAGRVLVADADYSRLRNIDPLRDSIRLLLEHDADSDTDDVWLHAGIVSAGSGTCPDGRAAAAVAVAAPLTGAVPGAPLRVVEVVEYRPYRDASGDRWFGTRSPAGAGWSAMSPISGPLAGTAGLRFGQPDTAGNMAGSVEVLDRLRRSDSLTLVLRTRAP